MYARCIYIYKFYNFEIVCAQVKASLYPQPLNVVSTLCLGENLLSKYNSNDYVSKVAPNPYTIP